MTNLNPTPGWDLVPELETDTQALGGPSGPMNLQAQALLNRTEYLRSPPEGIRTTESFGILGNGSDETQKISSAISFCASNGIQLKWNPSKTYGFTNIRVLGAGLIFDWEGQPSFLQLSTRDGTQNAIEIGGTIIAATTLVSTALAGSNKVSLFDASQVLPGDLIRLLTDRLAYGDHRFDPNNCFSQLVKVASVSGNDVYLVDPLLFDFVVAPVTSGTAQGGASGKITLSAADTSTRAQLKNYLLSITSGSGVGQSKYIHEYDPTTKIVDIGTSYSGFPQSDWTTIPDSTSQYVVSATVTASIRRPAFVRSLGGMEARGYAQNGVAVHGIQVSFCDTPQILGCNIGGFSRKALYTYHNYFPKVARNHFSGANEAAADGGGLGYGHVSLGDFGCNVQDNTATGCRTGFDGINGTMFLTRKGNKVRGGGATYDGNLFWPATNGYPNSGVSCHSASFGVTDSDNELCDVWDNKNRGMWHVVSNNSLRGKIQFGFQPSYTTGAVYIGNVYDDGMTVQPSSGMNGDVNGTEGLPTVSSILGRMQGLVNIRQNTLVDLATIVVKNNVVKSATESLVYITDNLATSDLALTVTDNDLSVVADVILTAAIVKANSLSLNLRDFTAYGNNMHVGGSALGTIKSDNMNKYPIIDSIPTTSAKTIQNGISQWVAILPNNSAARIAIPMGQLNFKFTIMERDGLVPNCFSGIVQRGNVTPIAAFFSNKVTFSTSNLTGTTGAVGDVTVSNRSSDGLLIVENRAGQTGKFIILVEGMI